SSATSDPSGTGCVRHARQRTHLRSPPLAACPRAAGWSALTADGRGGYVLAYEKDPDNHIAVRGRAGPHAR
ncbi:hypothetical protein ABZU45_04545, partial [Streptomyces avermitilis]